MVSEKKTRGAWGEKEACAFLISEGFSVVECNWREGHRELDIVARKGDTVHVVEVKTRRKSVYNDINSLVRPGQQRSILEAADAYARSHSWVKALQVDLLVIIVGGGVPLIEYYPDAIQPCFSKM